MAFALSIIHLEEAMKKPGCPICRLEYEAAINSIDAFLWENVNDPEVRKEINKSYGFCPYHTRMIVATELSQSGHVLGVNIIYEALAKNVARELESTHAKKTTRSSIRSVLNKIGLHTGEKYEISSLVVEGRCPICVLADGSGENALDTLMEQLEKHDTKFQEAFQHSNGICLQHLRKGLSKYSRKYPHAADVLVSLTAKQLGAEHKRMQQYIQKQNWVNKDEELSDEARTAWLRVLAFFTGLPPDKFTHKIEEF